MRLPPLITNSFLFLLLFSLGVSLSVLAPKRGLQLVSAAPVARDEVSELLYILVLVLHSVGEQREGPDELLHGQWTDALLLQAVAGQDLLTSDFDSARCVTMRDVREGAQREFLFNDSALLLDEGLPHHAPC